MQKILTCILVSWFCLATAYGQQKYLVNITVQDSSGFKQPAKIFAAGNFNGWNPAATALQYDAVKQVWLLNMELPAENYEFKFTRGSWEKVQCKKDGSDVQNNRFVVNTDTSFHFTIDAWKDSFEPVAKKHTASNHVTVMDTAFSIPQLHTTRRIWIYLPAGYATNKKRYPVLYMQDGQNVFDAYTSGFGEWGVDESIDSLSLQKNISTIVVAIDNGPRRLNEYNPFDNDRFGKGEGKEYVDFLVNNLKPYIDAHYRTLPDNKHSIIAGSSMGGLISYYAFIMYPQVFGKAGIFSPSFWIAPQMDSITIGQANKINGKLFFYMGGQEGEENIKDLQSIAEKLATRSSGLIYTVIDAGGRHNEEAWQKWFPEFFRWIMADWTNYAIDLKDN